MHILTNFNQLISMSLPTNNKSKYRNFSYLRSWILTDIIFLRAHGPPLVERQWGYISSSFRLIFFIGQELVKLLISSIPALFEFAKTFIVPFLFVKFWYFKTITVPLHEKFMNQLISDVWLILIWQWRVISVVRM